MNLLKNYYSKGKIKIFCTKLSIIFWFYYRFERLKAKDVNFEERFNHLGNVVSKNGVTEFNWDGNLEESSNEHWK